MRWWKIILSVVGALAILGAVLFATPILEPQPSDSVQAVSPPILTDGAGVKDFYLYVNQNIYAGYGSVTNDCNSLNFSITTFVNITKVHVEIMPSAPSLLDCPVTPGSFMYVHEFGSPQSGTINFELPDPQNAQHPAFVPGDWSSPVYMTVHADMTNGIYTGTAYAASCDPLTVWDCYTWPCANWAYYFPYTIVACP